MTEEAQAQEARMANVIEVTRQDIHWPFDGDGRPYLYVGGGSYPGRTYIDPFPCYPHDPELIRSLATEIEALWPLPFEVRWYVLPVEDLHRTNGWQELGCVYATADTPKRYIASIALAGKRIPIHPAMARYLVPHEYGHAVQEAIAFHRTGAADKGATILAEYREVRGLHEQAVYGGATWHESVGEVFANDFRILVAHAEVEFWPHKGIPRPEESLAAIGWWTKAREAMESQKVRA